MHRCLTFALLLSSVVTAQTPQAKPATVQSHQVNSDGSITFRYVAPNATRASLEIDASPKPLPMAKDSGGVWSVTTPVLPPEFYQYHFNIDGRARPDPLNTNTVRNITSPGNFVLVPGHPPLPWELTEIPHGRVDHHLYTTRVAKSLEANQEPYVVYTPPGYDPKRAGGYPVLYLLHGWTDTEYAWTEGGHADYILDRLIADGRAVPMIVVMPLGYGDFGFVTRDFAVWHDPAQVASNVALFGQMLLTEIVPQVEHEYNVASGREHRAIAGLSMGGRESLTVGLNHSDQFAWVGGMSSALFDMNEDAFTRAFPGVNAKAAPLRLLWVACGTGDGLITRNRQFIAWTKSKGLETVAVETPGAHTWLTWRDNLVTLAPLLFR